jgi:hypothetical protein
MDVGSHETTPPRMQPFTGSWDYYRELLKQARPGNPNITSVEETDAAVTIFTSAIVNIKLLETVSSTPTSRPGGRFRSPGTILEKNTRKEKHAQI